VPKDKYTKLICLINAQGFSEAKRQWMQQNQYVCNSSALALEQNRQLASLQRQSYTLEQDQMRVGSGLLVHFFLSLLFALRSLPRSLGVRDEVNHVQVLAPSLNGQTAQLLRLHVSDGSVFVLNNFSFSQLALLSSQNIIQLVYSILLERQIIFFYSRPELIPNVCESLLALVRPLKWRCLYTPYLPPRMWEILQMIVPYIVGVDRRDKELVTLPVLLTYYSDPPEGGYLEHCPHGPRR